MRGGFFILAITTWIGALASYGHHRDAAFAGSIVACALFCIAAALEKR